MASAAARTAAVKPQWATSARSAGATRMPPPLAPVSARLTATPRCRMNQGATRMLIAAPLMHAQPSAIAASAA